MPRISFPLAGRWCVVGGKDREGGIQCEKASPPSSPVVAKRLCLADPEVGVTINYLTSTKFDDTKQERVRSPSILADPPPTMGFPQSKAKNRIQPLVHISERISPHACSTSERYF